MKALLAGWLMLAATAAAAAPDCPTPDEVAQEHLLGLWRAEFEGLPQGATLLLERHPVYAQSLRGGINRDGRRGMVAADIEAGELTLEESDNGHRIDASWVGQVVAGSCGREIRGTWQATGADKVHAFTMRKL